MIYLASCLNIAKKEDSKHKSAFALYTREDVFGLIAESEDELNSWLKSLNIEKKKDEILNATGKLSFEIVVCKQPTSIICIECL